MVEEPLAELGEGQVLARVVYLSVDVGSRASLDLTSEYVVARRVGQVPMGSGAVAQVVASRHHAFVAGEFVATGVADYRSHLVLERASDPLLRKIDPAGLPLSAFAGVLGITGFIPWRGMFRCFELRPRECFVFSAAAGAVGLASGQFSRIAGARVVGIAGGPEKCAWLLEHGGFDPAVDYHADLSAGLAAAWPDGVDYYFDNVVGGAVTDAVFARMNSRGRIAVCGQMVQYDGAGPARGPGLMAAVLQRLSIRGFLSVLDWPEALPRFLEEATERLRQGRLGKAVSVVDGLENAAKAINQLMRGANIGKQLIRVHPDPTRA